MTAVSSLPASVCDYEVCYFKRVMMVKVSALYMIIYMLHVSLSKLLLSASRTFSLIQLCLNVLNRGLINNNMAKLAIEKPPALFTNSSGMILSEKKLHIDRIDEIILSDIASCCGLMTIADEEELLVDTAFLLVLLLEEVVVAETTCKRCRNRLLANPDKPNILIV